MERGFRLRRLVVGFAGAAVLLLLALSGFSAYEVDRHADARAWAKHSGIVVDLLQESRFQIELAEAARQAFLTTGEETSRDEVRRAAESLRANAEALQKLTTDNPARAAHAEELATLSAEIRASVETRAHHGAPREGNPAIMRAESVARSMEAEERGLQDERDYREQQSVDSALAALGAEVLFALTLACVALWLILRGIDQNERLLLDTQKPLALMQAVLDNVQAAVSLIDLDGRVIFVNKEYARIIGVRPEAAVGRLLAELMPLKEAAAIMEENLRVHTSGSVQIGERMFPGADGPRVYLTRKTPMPASLDRPAAVCSIATDVTPFKARGNEL